MNKCRLCGTKTKQKRQKYCSRECFYVSKKGKLRPEHGAKVSKALKGRAFSAQRCKNISEAKKRRFTDTELEKIKHVIQMPNVISFDATNKHLCKYNISISQRIHVRLRKEYAKQKELKFLPTKIQFFTETEWAKLVNGLTTKKSATVAKQYNLNKKTIKRILDFHNLRWIRSSPCAFKGETKIEKQVREYLEEHEVSYVQEFKLDKKYFDFLINDNVLIEIQGDFWHCNPNIYNQPIHKIQKRNIKNDKDKLYLAHTNGYKVIYIWEKQLLEHGDTILDKIIEENT